MRFVMWWIKKPLVFLIIAVSLVFSGCSPSGSPSAEIVGQWEVEDFVLDACAGEVDGTPYLFLLTQPNPMTTPSTTTLRVLNVDNPASPVEVASLEAPMSTLFPLGGLVLSRTELYVGLNESGAALWVVDVSSPESPQEIALLECEFTVQRPCVSGNYLAVSTDIWGASFAFFDISTPAQPEKLGDLELSPRPVNRSNWHTDYVGSMFYVVDKDGLAIVDVSSPVLPQEEGFYTNPDWEPEEPEGVEGAGTTVIYRMEEFDSLEEFFEDIFNSGSFIDVAVSERYAYVAAADSGLVVLDVSESELTEEVARLKLSGKAIRILNAGDLAYIMGVTLPEDSSTVNLHYSVHIVDISEPLAPRLVDSIAVVDTFPPFQSLVTLGDYIYFIDYQTVYIVDIYGGHR